MLAKYYKNPSHKNALKNLKNEIENGIFFKNLGKKLMAVFQQLPDSLDSVRQTSFKILKRLKNIKPQHFKQLFNRDSLAEFYQFIYKINNKQKVIFSLVIILVAAVLSLIKYNQNTMQDGAVFRRSVLSAWDYTSDRNTVGMKTSLKKQPTALAVLVERDNSQIEFQLPINNPSLEVKDNTATYINADQNMEVKYEFETNKLKESIILNSPTNNFEFTSSFLVQNLIVKMNDERIPVFFDTNNNYQFHFERPYAIDAAGQTTFALTYTLKPKTTTINDNPFIKKSQRPQNLLELETLQDIQVNTSEYELIVSVDPQWLLSPERQYPIIIDPTIVHDTSADFAVGSFNRVTDTGSGAAPVLESYYQELTADEQTGGLWHFNEASGNVLDASNNNNTGTPTGTTVVTGLFGNARSFNGSSNYINVNDNGSLNFTGDFTLEAWIKTTDTGNSTNIVTYGDTSDWMYIMTKDATDNLRCKIYNNNAGSGYLETNTTKKINDGNWRHVACVASGTTLSAYIDGELASVSNTTSGTRDTGSAGPLTIGAFNWTTYQSFFNGQIDEVRLAGVARSAEEIKAAAQRRPYAVYTSPVIDLGTNENAWSDFQKLSWTESGGQTGDGETPSNTSGLVAQWDFNETSGGTAATSNGSCGAICNGTLYNFTAGYIEQDANPSSGWTSDRRWGAGALKFDDANDYVEITDNSSIQFSSEMSIEVWVLPPENTGSQRTIHKIRTSPGQYSYALQLDTAIPIWGVEDTTSNMTRVDSRIPLNANQWNHVVGTFDGTTRKIYINGVDATTTGASTLTNSGSNTNLQIGRRSDNSQFFKGILDSVKLYSRVLTAAEVKDNYNATNVQFQTRAGADSTPNDGSWEDWKPADESLLKDFEETYLYDSTDASLYAYWPMDETADNTCAGGTDICDKKSTKHLTVSGSGSKIRSGKFNNGRSLPGGSATEYFSISGLSDFPTTAITTEFWIKTTDTTDGIISYDQGGTANEWLIYDSSNLKIYRGSGGLVATNVAVNDGRWHHVAVTWSSDTGLVELYKDGTRVYYASLAPGTSIAQNGSLVIGQDQDGEMAGFDPAQAFGGEIDELKIYNTVLDADTIAKNYLQGSLNPDNLSTQTSSNIKVTGNQALKTEAGILKADQYTVGLWRLNETGGTGAYIKDESGNNYHGTPTGTTVTDGLISKARSFNGTSDFIDIGVNHTVIPLFADNTQSWTVEAWYKNPASTGTNQMIVGRGGGTGGSATFAVFVNTTGGISTVLRGTNSTLQSAGATDNKWHHVAVTWNGSVARGYFDGGPAVTLSVGTAAIQTSLLNIGATANGGSLFFGGAIDEVRISNVARSATEIAENYRQGRDHYLNYALTTTQDLSNKSTLPFYVAADRPGTYLAATIGESAFANYQPDKNTVSLYRFEEINGSGVVPRDSSGNSNHFTGGTINSTVEGVLGKANGYTTSQYNTGGGLNGLDGASITIDFWAYLNFSTPVNTTLMYATPDVTTNRLNIHLPWSNGYLYWDYGDINNVGRLSTPFDAGWYQQWAHWAFVSENGVGQKIYRNGVLIAADNTAGTFTKESKTLSLQVASWQGFIDELRISNVARSAEEIRQAYDIGKRTHSITIDFGAKLDSGNLITGSGDTSFIVDATIYGLSNKGSNLYEGDKIIVRENYDGTEYIAQGTVDSVNASTGAVTVSAWDSGGTFPTGGFTANAEVFKWQREFFDLTGSKPEHRNTASLLTFRLTNGHEGRTIWLDDVKAATDYLTTPLGSAITSTTGNRYVQYRTIFTATDTLISGTLASVAMGGFDGSTTSTGSCYLEESPHDDQITLHWTDNATGELGFEIEKRINGTTWTLVDRTSANVNSYNDENISANNTYQYRVRSFADDGSTGDWCATAVVDLGTGSFQFEGLQMEGIKID